MKKFGIAMTLAGVAGLATLAAYSTDYSQFDKPLE